MYSMVDRYGLNGLRPSQAVCVAPHLLDAVAAQDRAQVGQVARHGAAIGQPARGGGPLGRCRPAFGPGRPAEQGEDQRPVHGHGRVPLDQLPLLEPLHPSQDRVHATARPHGLHHLHDQPRDVVAVAGLLRVVNGQLTKAVGLEPGGRPKVEPGHDLRFTSPQLGAQQIPEQVVIAVPLVPPVQRDQQQVGPLEGHQHRARPCGAEHRVAQRPAHPLQHRGPGQERHLVLGQPGQQLRPQVIGHKPVVPREPKTRGRFRASGLDGQGREVQADRPALGPLDQLAVVSIAETNPHGLKQQHASLGRIHGQVVHANLHHLSGGPQPRHRQRRRAARSDRQLRPGRQVQRQRGDRVAALLI